MPASKPSPCWVKTYFPHEVIGLTCHFMRVNRDKIVIFSLIAVVLLLQYPLWFGNSSVFNVWRLRWQIEKQEEENRALLERNKTLQAEVEDLKHGLAAVEERSRRDMGMVKKDETFFHVIDQEPEKKKK